MATTRPPGRLKGRFEIMEHVRENRAAADIALTVQDLADLDAASPPPRQAGPLDMI